MPWSTRGGGQEARVAVMPGQLACCGDASLRDAGSYAGVWVMGDQAAQCPWDIPADDSARRATDLSVV